MAGAAGAPMKFACESCRAQYMISDEKVGPRGVKFRCKKCNHTNVVRRPSSDAPVAAAPPRSEAALPPGSLDDEIGAAFDNVVTAEGEQAAEPGDQVADDQGHLLQPEAQRIFEEPRNEPAPLPPEQVDWFVAKGDQQQGPLKFAEIKERWERAEIGPDTLCWREGLADWQPLSQISELAGSLAPPAQPAADVSASVSSWKSEGKAAKEEPTWRPSAASALASLVQEEKEAARQEPPPQEPTQGAGLPPVESTAVRTLLQDLPEPPPVEPSRVIPMSSLPAAIAAGAPPRQEAPAKAREGKKGLLVGIAASVLVLGGVGAYATGFFGGPSATDRGGEPAPVVARAPTPEPKPLAAAPVAPPVQEPQAADVKPQEPEAEEAARPVDTVAEAEPARAPEEKVEPQQAKAPAEAEAVAALEKAPEPQQAQKVEAPKPAPATGRVPPAPVAPAKKTAPAPAPVKAVAEAPAPPPKPARASKDLLSAGNSSSIDDLFEKEFSAPPPPAKKSGAGGTYIPPAPGGGGAKPHTLGQGDILAVVASHKAPLKTCATNYKSSSGQSSGTVVMRWSIKRDGKTTGVQPVKGAEHKELASCIGGLVKGWTFPAYDGPQMAPIEFPFQF